jgi:adenosylcobinamide-GDP ribazoletransferase
MDSVDGLFGGRTPERRLEIMRDSRVGSFGALAGALALLLKFATLSALLPDARAGALVAALVAGRWTQVLAVWLFPAARPEGLGAAFKEGLRLPAIAVATILGALATLLALGPAGPLVLLLTVPVTLSLGRWMASTLGGGLSGDSYGALSEVAEVTVLLALVSPLPPLLTLRGGAGG